MERGKTWLAPLLTEWGWKSVKKTVPGQKEGGARQSRVGGRVLKEQAQRG